MTKAENAALKLELKRANMRKLAQDFRDHPEDIDTYFRFVRLFGNPDQHGSGNHSAWRSW
jgi:hypothetical protein